MKENLTSQNNGTKPKQFKLNNMHYAKSEKQKKNSSD
jgi:hypothetical protein